MMYETYLTIGLFDKDEHFQLVETESAHKLLADLLIDGYGVYAFTMIDCLGVYRHKDGSIVREPSIRIEIAAEEALTVTTITCMVKTIKIALNQESVMVKRVSSNIEFI